MNVAITVVIISSLTTLVGAVGTIFIALRRIGRVEERSVVRDEYEGMVDRMNAEILRLTQANSDARAEHAQCVRFQNVLIGVLRTHGIEVPDVP